jgi:hypothetical protein
MADGRLAADRLESYVKLQDELAALSRQQQERAQIEEKRRGKAARPSSTRSRRLT